MICAQKLNLTCDFRHKISSIGIKDVSLRDIMQ